MPAGEFIILFYLTGQISGEPGQLLGWAQSDLVERFLDFLFLMRKAWSIRDLVPVFHPSNPVAIIGTLPFYGLPCAACDAAASTKSWTGLAIGAYAWSDNQPLNWGAGGPERWPSARPYFNFSSDAGPSWLPDL